MTIYKLFWDEFSAWYLELVKPAYQQPIDALTYQKTLAYFEQLLLLLHPFMPFITEELWQHLVERRDGESIMLARQPETRIFDQTVIERFEVAKSIVSAVRNLRVEKGLSAKQPLRLEVLGAHDSGYDAVLRKLGNVSAIEPKTTKSSHSVPFMVGTTEYAIPLSTSTDYEEERLKMEKELTYLEGFLQSVEKKLANERFLSNARAEVIESERKKKSDTESKIKALKNRLSSLG
jgi:valyl-tRNA synthetase